MQAHDTLHNQTLRDEVGNAGLHISTNTLEDSVSSYSVIAFKGSDLPKQYEGLIYAKWLRSLRHGNEYFKLIDAQAFFSSYHPFIRRLLSSPDTTVRLAILTGDPDVVLGFSVCRRNILDYVHVLRIRTPIESGLAIANFRNMGIGKNLIPKEIDTFTHITKSWLSVWNGSYRRLKFNPFI